jgi:glycosyltransferase involved in cell wall biosynthesis
MFGRPGEISGEELESAVRTRNLSSRTLVAGFRSPAARNIASLDVLAAPAVAEPFGRTPVEALFLGVPYVVTDDAGHGEILRRWGGGLAAGRSDPPEEFARLLDNVLQAPEAVTLPASKRAQVASDLSVSRHAGAVMEIYVRLRPSPGARHGSEAVAGL